MSLCLFVCFVVRDKIKKQHRLQRITLGKKVLKIGQKIEWGRERHKQFWSFGGYNFVSFKGMTLKLIQATILDARKILE